MTSTATAGPVPGPGPTTLDGSVRLVDDGVLVLDRRVFPARTEWVLARTDVEVAAAIRDMVTQSSGPYFAALAGLALVARQRAGGSAAEALAALRTAGERLVAARPTNNAVRDGVAAVLARVPATAVDGAAVARAVAAAAADGDAAYRRRSRLLAEHTAALLPDGALVLTHCWMDTYLTALVEAATDAGRTYRWVVTETRPYLQGARLSAHALRELDQDVTLVTDGMVAAVLDPRSRLGQVDALVTAADRVSLDGHVVNKVGTLGAALAAREFGVPFHALVQAPDRHAPTVDDIEVEERDGAEVLSVLGLRTASPLVTQAYYPAFDVTPPSAVTTVVTDRGPFAPHRVADYWNP